MPELADLIRERFADVRDTQARLRGTLDAAAAITGVEVDGIRGVDDRDAKLLVAEGGPLPMSADTQAPPAEDETADSQPAGADVDVNVDAPEADSGAASDGGDNAADEADAG